MPVSKMVGMETCPLVDLMPIVTICCRDPERRIFVKDYKKALFAMSLSENLYI